MFELIVFVVFVVISILAEVSKNKDKTKNEEVDLESLEDFFKKRKPEPTTMEHKPASSSCRSGEFQSLEEPIQGGRFGSTETAFPDFERAGSSEFQFASGLPPIPVEESNRHLEQRQKQKKPKKSKKQKQGAHESDEGPCLDREPTLTGAVNLERMAMGAFRGGSRPGVATMPSKRGIPLTWNRNRLIDAVIMSELLQRYDLNRVFSRIPTPTGEAGRLRQDCALKTDPSGSKRG